MEVVIGPFDVGNGEDGGIDIPPVVGTGDGGGDWPFDVGNGEDGGIDIPPEVGTGDGGGDWTIWCR